MEVPTDTRQIWHSVLTGLIVAAAIRYGFPWLERELGIGGRS